MDGWEGCEIWAMLRAPAVVIKLIKVKQGIPGSAVLICRIWGLTTRDDTYRTLFLYHFIYQFIWRYKGQRAIIWKETGLNMNPTQQEGVQYSEYFTCESWIGKLWIVDQCFKWIIFRRCTNKLSLDPMHCCHCEADPNIYSLLRNDFVNSEKIVGEGFHEK